MKRRVQSAVSTWCIVGVALLPMRSLIASAQAQTGSFTVLHSFGEAPDGASPYGGLILDSAGNLYGTKSQGGSLDCGCGAVFKLDPSGKETVLYRFNGMDGSNPDGGLVRDSAGNLYGTTVLGGTSFLGNVFKLDPSGHLTVLYSFRGQPDGASPYAGLIRDSEGNLYGTTIAGGGGTCLGLPAPLTG